LENDGVRYIAFLNVDMDHSVKLFLSFTRDASVWRFVPNSRAKRIRGREDVPHIAPADIVVYRVDAD